MFKVSDTARDKFKEILAACVRILPKQARFRISMSN